MEIVSLLIFVALVLLAILRVIQVMRDRATIVETAYGFDIVTRSCTRRVAWRDIEDAIDEATFWYPHGTAAGGGGRIVHRFTLRLRNESEIVLEGGAAEALLPLWPRLEELHFRRAYSTHLAEFDAGKRLTFCDQISNESDLIAGGDARWASLSIARGGVSYDGQALHWGDLDYSIGRGGHLRLKDKRHPARGVSIEISLSECASPALLMFLLRKNLGEAASVTDWKRLSGATLF